MQLYCDLAGHGGRGDGWQSCQSTECGVTSIGRGRHPSQLVIARDPSLLEKLLATDIRAEHSRLLQCMRFFVANNFLQDVGTEPLLYPPEPPSAVEQPPGEYHQHKLKLSMSHISVIPDNIMAFASSSSHHVVISSTVLLP